VPEPILVAEGFSYSYPESARPALSDVSLELDTGSFIVFAGESGSGKSTLLRAACGIVPHFHGGEAGRCSRTPSRRW
jgi:energy-coupling factor transport system ATP-binding protein